MPRRLEPPGLPWRVRLPTAVLGLTLVVSACSADPTPGPTPGPGTADQAVAALAAGLAKRDVSQVAFTGATGGEVNAQLGPLVAGMGTLKPAVTVAAVDTQGSAATATLRYAWTFPGVPQQWTYDTSAALVHEGGDWKTTWRPTILQPGLDGNNRLSERREAAPRGEILGADGEAIVTARPVVRIGIDKTRVAKDKVAGSAGRLAELVDIDAKAYLARVRAAGPQDYVEAIVLRDDADDRPSNAEVSAIDGAVPIGGELPLPPSRDFARALLGSVGPAPKENVEESSGALTAGDQVGRSGLQRRYDEQLRGRPGVLVRLVPKPASATPSAGSPTASPSAAPTPSATPAPAQTVFESKPVAGKDLSITLSVPLQQLAEKTLDKTRPASALVAIQPSTGRILAAANGPGSGDQPLATVGRFPPGSTFKVASSLALLRAGLTPSSPVRCPATITVDGKRFKNYSDYPSSRRGKIDLRTALAQSCNTAFIGERDQLRDDQLADAAASLGVGIDYDVGFASYFGSVPDDPSATGRAAAMIGQGKVLASPMAMAAVAASVQAGRTVVPNLITGTQASPSSSSSSAKAQPLTKAEAGDLRRLMAAVVSSGSGRVLGRVPGPTVIGKTGTAEFGPRAPFSTHAWMIAAQGDLAVAVFVEKGASGSRTAGPLLATFLADDR